MKRIIIIALFAVMTAKAQPVYFDLDTVKGRIDNCWYSMWYDECPLYWSDSNQFTFTNYGSPIFHHDTSFTMRVLAKEQKALGRMAVKGLAAMVSIDASYLTNNIGMVDTNRSDEYLILLQGGYSTELPDYYFPPYMTYVNMVRWDTASPILLKLPQNNNASADSTDFLYCYLYQAYFPEPIIVDSTFFIAGTFRSNTLVNIQVSPDMTQTKLEHYPTVYVGVTDTINTLPNCNKCPAQLWSDRLYGGPPFPFNKDNWQGWHINNYNNAVYGPFMPIVDFYQLTVQTDNPDAGGVTGSGRFPAMSITTIRAIPLEGYRFSHWSDGHTESVRNISLDSDKTYTAFFEEED